MDMGAQTFDDKLRKNLCLPDSAADVEKAIRHARELNLCVCVTSCITCLARRWKAGLTRLRKQIELDVEIDAYSLHVDPGTPLEKMIKTGVSPPTGDAEYEKQMYLAAYKHVNGGRIQSRGTRTATAVSNGICVRTVSTAGHGEAS